MKTLIAISLSFLVFFQSAGMSISDVFMLSDLIEHAKLHSEEYGDDFYTFFEKHYGTLKAEHEQSQQGENHTHENLPFQHNNCNHLITEVVLTNHKFFLEKTDTHALVKPKFYYKNLYSFLERATIFQPPKIA